MILWSTVVLALGAIRRNAGRSILTALGVVIGVGSVIAMVNLGQAAGQQVTANIAAMGPNLLFVRPAFIIGRGLWKKGDGAVIDGLGPDGIAARTLNLAQGASRLQTGYVYHYAFAMLVGVVVIMTWYFFSPQIAAILGAR